MRFCVIGAGSWGTALAMYLASVNHEVLLYTHDHLHAKAMIAQGENAAYLPGIAFPKKLQVAEHLDFSWSDYVILIAVPSCAFVSCVTQYKDKIAKAQGLVWATKGLLSDAVFISDFLQETFSKNYPCALLSGPSFAKEVARAEPTLVALVGEDSVFLNTMQQAFHSGVFRSYVCDDWIGAQLGGAIKNIYAIAVGMADGLGLGANARAALVTRALAEMRRLAEKMGAKDATLMGLTGIGDLILTCSDNQSRNRRFGLYLGQGLSIQAALEKVEQVVEGYEAVKQAIVLSERAGVSMPILDQVHQVLYHGQGVKVALDALMTRSVGQE